ncbi:MAG: ATP-binding protein [Desulfobacteraceae bacterium]|nr:ATP-binding protein [Desulfobacteraceae bacterium]MDH3567531.1 ATP-binding protein [Desulfobacteraceae bacterium]
MGLYKRKPIYIRLQRKIVLIILCVSIIPLVVLGETIYYRFAGTYEEKIEDQIKYRARSQSDAVEIFLKERTAILSTIVDTHSFDELKQQESLTRIFKVISRRTDGLIDLGVIDNTGQHLAYSGPYNLEGLNYYQQAWFQEIMSKGKYISDVYMGYRQSPHFIIAVRGYSNGRMWILRATVDSDIFNKLVRTAQTGRSGDAYIINKNGIYQTDPRFSGKILGQSSLSLKLFGEGTTVAEKIEADGQTKHIAGTWLKNNEWLLVITQDVGDEKGGLLTTRSTEIIIIIFGCLAIIVTTFFSIRIIFRRLEDSDKGISELNEQLIQSDKMAALGKMAAGIAHEINNPLAVIGEKAGWMRDLLLDEKFQKSENIKEYATSIDKIEEHVERARKVTHNMLGFARRMEHRLDDIDINTVLNQTIELLENHAQINNIEISRDFQADLPIIASDQSQIQQVFLNLMNNAIDAIQKDGLIEVETREENSQIVIRIKDNGPGIPREYLKKIFDPFFTTKEVGKGTGLGLSVSYNIVEKLGGAITVESKVSEGTIFNVKLPIVMPGKK